MLFYCLHKCINKSALWLKTSFIAITNILTSYKYTSNINGNNDYNFPATVCVYM